MKLNYLIYGVAIIFVCVPISMGIDVLTHSNTRNFLVDVSLMIRSEKLFAWSAQQLYSVSTFPVTGEVFYFDMGTPNNKLWSELGKGWHESGVRSESYSQDQLAHLFFVWGRTMVLNGQINASVSWFSAARKTAPWWSYFWVQEARVLLELEKSDEAKNVLSQCAVIKRTQTQCLDVLSQFRYLSNEPIDYQHLNVLQRVKK